MKKTILLLVAISFLFSCSGGSKPKVPNEPVAITALEKESTINYWNYLRDDAGFQYSLDDGKTWEYWRSEQGSGYDIVLQKGQTMLIRGYNYWCSYYNKTRIYCAEPIKVSGNIMSLLGIYTDPNEIKGEYAFSNLFEGCSGLVDASELQMPAIKLSNCCYYCMFQYCINLTKPPVLPATELATSCYRQMFESCRSLETPPNLPATTMEESCYWQMFKDCEKLKTAPELPATTLKHYCYRNMFWGCKSLLNAPNIPAKKLAEECCDGIFYNCKELASATISATEISYRSLDYAFYGCTSLKTLEVHFTTFHVPGSLSWYDTEYWLTEASSDGTIYCPKELADKDTYSQWDDSMVREGWTIVNI